MTDPGQQEYAVQLIAWAMVWAVAGLNARALLAAREEKDEAARRRREAKQ